jgi:hypothetical protein
VTDKEKKILMEYLPEKAVDQVVELIVSHNIHFRIANSRSTKFGDYRPPVKKSYHQISVNHDLNPYAFLITFIHEVAHLRVFEKYKFNVSSPHGKEWKTEYRSLMNQFLNTGIFPEDLKQEIARSIVNSKASSTSDITLYRTLKKYDDQPRMAGVVDLETLKEGQLFLTKNGQRFKKAEKRRIRYRCLNMQNNQWYLFHPLTPVLPVDGQQ